MNITRSQYLSYALGVVALIAIGIFGGYQYGKTEAKTVQVPASIVGAFDPTASTTDFTLFWKVWNLLDEKFASDKNATVTDQEKLYGAIQGLAESYGDPYTTFFPPEDRKAFDSEIEGSFEGVGMEISIKDDVLTVVAPLEDSPAQKAGMRAGDKILKIGDKITTDLTVEEAIKLIRGPKGTSVVLTVVRAEESSPREITIVRDVINVPIVKTEKTPEGVFIIHFYSFSANSPTLFRNALKSYMESGSNKLIIDLRGNPGGYLDAAVDIASWFLPADKPVVIEDFKDRPQKVYNSKGYNVIGPENKIVILIDGGSASASEIFAGAMHEYGRATLVGTKSFGKGSVQEYIPVSADTALKVTVARWLTPKGATISGNGIKPDVEVKYTEKDRDAKLDPQLEKAKQILLGR